MSRFWSKGGQSSTATDHKGPIGSLTFDPLDSHTSQPPRYAKLYFLWIISVIQLIWAQFHWNRTSLKIWPLYKRSMTFTYFDLYLKNETSYEFCVIEFFAPYDQGRIWHALQLYQSMLTILVPCYFIPLLWPPMHPTDFSVHPRSVH